MVKRKNIVGAGIVAEDANADSSLPASGDVRWTSWRKAAVVAGIREGAITASEAGDLYMLSCEELAAWDVAFDRDGLAGLQQKRCRWPFSRTRKDKPALQMAHVVDSPKRSS
jgi:hypothetical protein